MPDGKHILVSEHHNNRLSLFTLAGEFVRVIGVGAVTGPRDVDFAPNGDILVANCHSQCNRVSVLSPDGSTVLRSFDEGDSPFKFDNLISLAVHDNQVYVLGFTAPIVLVFR